MINESQANPSRSSGAHKKLNLNASLGLEVEEQRQKYECMCLM